jgi:hypothetical protein
LTFSRQTSWVYCLPILHLCVFAIANVGLLSPSLQYLGRLESYLILADLPVSIVVFGLAWHYPMIAALWIVVVGTLWWYLLSRLLELGIHKLMRKDASFPSLKL